MKPDLEFLPARRRGDAMGPRQRAALGMPWRDPSPGPRRFAAPARPRWLKVALPLLLAATLAACGGSDDDTPVAAATAMADSANVTWNEAATLNVTSNDTVANGTATVTIQSAPAHGTATVSGNAIQYTPATGYFGADTLRYTLTVGNASSQADVAIKVAAKLTLKGVAADAPLAGASVVATVGANALPAVTADAAGAYQLTIETSDPAAFISLVAKGTGAQAAVVLSSLVGDASAVAALAMATPPAAGAAASAVPVDAAALPTLNVSHLSTATAVLTQQALGKAPASAADVASVKGSFSPAQMIEMATAIQLIADQGVALPAGSADTLALVSNAAAYKSFVLAQAAAGDAFQVAQQAVMADPSLAVAPPLPSASAPSTLLLVSGWGISAQLASRVVLQADKTARIESDQVSSATWALNGNDLELTYDTPITYQTYSGDNDPVTNEQNLIEHRATMLVVRLLGDGNTALIGGAGESEYLDGSRKGQVVADPAFWYGQKVVATTTAIVASDVAAGTRWSGVLTADTGSFLNSTSQQDVLRIVDATQAAFEHVGQTGTWRLVDGKLELTIGGAVFTYTRLFTGPRGEERWLAEKRVDSKLAWVYDVGMVKAQAGVAFTAAGLIGKWQNYIYDGISQGQSFIELLADGSSNEIFASPGQPDSISGGGRAWSLGADGLMTQTQPSCQSGQTDCQTIVRRTWQPIAIVGNRLYVLEWRGSFGSGQYRSNIYDLTP